MGIKSTVVEQLEGELSVAKEAKKNAEKEVIFRTGQIERLTTTLTAVKSTLTAEDDQGTVSHKAKATPKSSLPRTGNEFWMTLITEKPQKTAEIHDAACAKLGITSEEDKATLKNRQNFALKALVDAKSVASEGSQQNRTYFLPKKG